MKNIPKSILQKAQSYKKGWEKTHAYKVHFHNKVYYGIYFRKYFSVNLPRLSMVFNEDGSPCDSSTAIKIMESIYTIQLLDIIKNAVKNYKKLNPTSMHTTLKVASEYYPLFKNDPNFTPDVEEAFSIYKSDIFYTINFIPTRENYVNELDKLIVNVNSNSNVLNGELLILILYLSSMHYCISLTNMHTDILNKKYNKIIFDYLKNTIIPIPSVEKMHLLGNAAGSIQSAEQSEILGYTKVSYNGHVFYKDKVNYYDSIYIPFVISPLINLSEEEKRPYYTVHENNTISTTSFNQPDLPRYQ